jgi:hypothetical protein
MRRLPLSYSCDRRWSEMEGGDAVRTCHDCDCPVVNLSSLDESSARTLLRESTGPACVRYRYRGGHIVFAKARRALAIAAAAAVLLGPPARADTTPPPPRGKKQGDKQQKKKHAQAPPKVPEDDGIIMGKF